MKQNLILAFLFICITRIAVAQQPCATFEYENYLNIKFPGFEQALKNTRQQSANALGRLHKVGDNDTVYRIPVVFHIVWSAPAQNLHDSLILSQVKAINESYSHTHKDTTSIRDLFKPLAGNTKIEFYLADTDPNGNPTNGINRVKTTRTDFNDGTSLFGEAVKFSSSNGVNAWDPERYLNIWVCRFTYKGNVITAAYAFPPTNAKNWNSAYYKSLEYQGVVVNYQYVGKNNPYDLSQSSIRERTLVHEIGHYLGLRHIWADKSNCTGEDDGIKDTPNCASATTSCSKTKNTCISTEDKPDMTENYMDYTPYPCTVMFTKEQAALMKYNLKNLRPYLPQLKITTKPPLPYVNISISPNPVKGEMKMHFDQTGIFNVVLTDIIGQQVINKAINVTADYEFNMPVSIASGVYFLSISQNNKVVLKQRILSE